MRTLENNLTECPICKGCVVRETREKNISYKEKHLSVLQPGWYCDNCSEEFLSKKDIQVTRKEIVDFKRRVDGYLTSEDIIAFRQKFSLSQKNASTLLGGGPMAFSKYERGIVTQNRAVDLLIRLLVSGKITLKDLEI